MSTEQPIQEISKVGNITFSFIGSYENTISPLAKFAGCLPKVLNVFAPSIIEILNNNHFSICLIDDNIINAFCDKQNKIIYLTTGCMEFFWLSIFSNISLALEAKKARSSGNEDEEFGRHDFYVPSDVLAANQRCKALCGRNITPWPLGIPRPECNYDLSDGMPASYACEMIQYALGFFILHELGHWVVWNSGKESKDPITKERQCDAFAVKSYLHREWFNQELPGDRSNAFKKKMLALLECGAMLTFLDQLRSAGNTTHPDGIDRLKAMFDEENTGEANIFDFENEENYKPNDPDFDIRPSVGYAADMLYFYLQNVVEPPTEQLRERCNEILHSKYESPKELFETLSIYFKELELVKRRN